MQCHLLPLASALAGKAFAGVVHKDLPHQPGSHREKMRPALPGMVRLLHQPQPGFVDQRRRLQRVAGAFAAHMTRGGTA